MEDAHDTLVKLLDAVSEGVRFQLTGVFDMKGEYNWSIKPRVLNEDMIVFSRGNKGYYEINGERYPLKTGRFIFISHSTKHSSGQYEFEFANVLAIRYRHIDCITATDASDRCPIASFIYDCSHNKIYENLFLNVYRNRFSANYSKGLLLHYCIVAIYAQLFSDIVTARRPEDGGIPYFMEKNAEYINECIHNSTRIDVDYLAASFGITRKCYLRKFKDINCVGFKQYVYERKMAYAAYLLTETDMKVKNVADYLGYSDQYIFANMFKQFYYVSPHGYSSYYTM